MFDLDARWKSLYTIAGFSAIISILVILLGFVTYFIWPYIPGQDSAENILLLLHNDPLGGLISLDLFLFIGNLFSLALFLTLYISLRKVDEAIALLALVVGLIGLVLLIPARPILELVHLSQAYMTSGSLVEKTQIVGTAATLLALFDGVGWYLNTLLGGLSLLTSSILMLRSSIYSKATAYVGIATNLVLCGFVIPPISLLMLFLSLPGYIIWYVLLARRFFRLAHAAR
jgi:hypothetical protein